MQNVLSANLWKTVKAEARKAQQRKAAIAYVTQDLLGFRQGDVLLVDASKFAISNGETDAKLLRTLQQKGVRLYDCPGLHAKVILLDKIAVIGSGNMSNSSAQNLVEAALMTDHRRTVSGVASFIEQLVQQAKELSEARIATLCQIKVVRRGSRPQGSKKIKPQVKVLGNRTWLIGVQEYDEPITSPEQELIDQANESLRVRAGKKISEATWVRLTGNSRFIDECQVGDSIIQIWSDHKGKRPSEVWSSTPILLKQKTRHWTRIYITDARGKFATLSWDKFKQLLKRVGYKRAVGGNSEQLLNPDIADALDLGWKAMAKQKKSKLFSFAS